MEPIDANHGRGDEDQVIAMRKRAFPELHGRGENQAHGGRGHALEHRGDEGAVSMLVVEHADRVHEHTAGQADPDDGGQGSGGAAQAVTHQHSHVRGIQAGQCLADRQQLHEFLVGDPPSFRNQGVPQIGDNTAAEAGGSDQQKLKEDRGNRNIRIAP